MSLRFLELAQLQANQDADESSVMQYQVRISFVLLCVISGYLWISQDSSKLVPWSHFKWQRSDGKYICSTAKVKDSLCFSRMNQYRSIVCSFHHDLLLLKLNPSYLHFFLNVVNSLKMAAPRALCLLKLSWCVTPSVITVRLVSSLLHSGPR